MKLFYASGLMDHDRNSSIEFYAADMMEALTMVAAYVQQYRIAATTITVGVGPVPKPT